MLKITKKTIFIVVIVIICFAGSFLAGIKFMSYKWSYEERVIDCMHIGSDARALGCVNQLKKIYQTESRPLNPNKDIYQVGEDITYSYLTLKIESVKRLSANEIEVDLYEYNSENNPNKLLIFNSQFYLEAPDNTRVQPNYDDGRLRGVEVYPDEAKRGRVLFQNDALKSKIPFILKVQPFEGSPALSVDIHKYLEQ